MSKPLANRSKFLCCHAMLLFIFIFIFFASIIGSVAGGEYDGFPDALAASFKLDSLNQRLNEYELRAFETVERREGRLDVIDLISKSSICTCAFGQVKTYFGEETIGPFVIAISKNPHLEQY